MCCSQKQFSPQNHQPMWRKWASVFLSGLVTLSSCDVATLPGAETIKLSYDTSEAKGCKYLGPIDTGHLLWIEDDHDAQVDQEADLKNAALTMGGNIVIIPPLASPSSQQSTIKDVAAVAAQVYLCVPKNNTPPAKVTSSS